MLDLGRTTEAGMMNIAAADTLMGIFGFRRITKICPYCNGMKDVVPGKRPRPYRSQCWRAKKHKMVCPKQDGRN